jgi:glycosyltransferase involved in cell wall biosynthesis
MVKILEYLAVGLPIVATALRETVVTGGYAITTVAESSADLFIAPLMALLTSPRAWQENADKARARGLQLQWPVQAAELVRAYSSLSGPGNQNGP